MSLKEQLMADLKAAMKEKDTIKKATVTMVRAGILQVEKDKKIELDDEGVLEVITKQIKQRKDALVDFEKAGRDDLIEKANAELAVLMLYMPEQMSEEELRQIVQAAVNESGAQSVREMGKVMSLVMPQVKGKADGKVVNSIVKELLN